MMLTAPFAGRLRARPGLLVSALAVALASTGSALEAQEPRASREPGRILGHVVDASGIGIAGVTVRLLPPAEGLVITNAEGRFVFEDVPAAFQEVEISRLGYGRHTQVVNVPEGRTVQMRIELSEQALELGTITVRVELRNRQLEAQGFYDRSRSGFGRYFDPEYMEGQSLINVLHMVPRIRMARGRGGFSHTPFFRRGMRNCVPMLWVDRTPVRLRGWSLEEMVDRYDVAALEVYTPGNTPGEFIDFDDCGAIVVWTRTRNPG